LPELAPAAAQSRTHQCLPSPARPLLFEPSNPQGQMPPVVFRRLEGLNLPNGPAEVLQPSDGPDSRSIQKGHASARATQQNSVLDLLKFYLVSNPSKRLLWDRLALNKWPPDSMQVTWPLIPKP